MERRRFIKDSLLLYPALTVPGSFLSYSDQLLPNVLILGDSISIGYTPFVQELLAGKANVYRPTLENKQPENCEGTTKGVTETDRWVDNLKWDIIHFNFGLHDIKHVNPETGENSTNPQNPQQADIKQYKKNLEEIVGKLKATGAKLIFATTTPYPDVTNGPLRKPGMPAKYNKIAVKIMNRNNIEINDLFAFMLPRMAELQLPNNVHFSPEGYKALAEKVAERIDDALNEIEK